LLALPRRAGHIPLLLLALAALRLQPVPQPRRSLRRLGNRLGPADSSEVACRVVVPRPRAVRVFRSITPSYGSSAALWQFISGCHYERTSRVRNLQIGHILDALAGA